MCTHVPDPDPDVLPDPVSHAGEVSEGDLVSIVIFDHRENLLSMLAGYWCIGVHL